jgi:hypothetical protein
MKNDPEYIDGFAEAIAKKLLREFNIGHLIFGVISHETDWTSASVNEIKKSIEPVILAAINGDPIDELCPPRQREPDECPKCGGHLLTPENHLIRGEKCVSCDYSTCYDTSTK